MQTVFFGCLCFNFFVLQCTYSAKKLILFLFLKRMDNSYFFLSIIIFSFIWPGELKYCLSTPKPILFSLFYYNITNDIMTHIYNMILCIVFCKKQILVIKFIKGACHYIDLMFLYVSFIVICMYFWYFLLYNCAQVSILFKITKCNCEGVNGQLFLL